MDLRGNINREIVSDGQGKVKHIGLTAAAPTYQIKISDSIIIATAAAGGDGVAIVTLPPVAEAAGKMYYICAPTGATGDDISVYIKETGAEFAAKGDMDADDDYGLFMSDGRQWRCIIGTGA